MTPRPRVGPRNAGGTSRVRGITRAVDVEEGVIRMDLSASGRLSTLGSQGPNLRLRHGTRYDGEVSRAIVAIGGGEIKTRGTLGIDREIIGLSNKRRPKIVFVPTASSDSLRYCRRFSDYFGGVLGCKTDTLLLLNEQPSAQQIKKKIMSADIVYVGG